MNINKNAASPIRAAESFRKQGVWAATAALVVALVLALSVAIPQVAALESPERFSSQAEAIEFYLAELESERQRVSGVLFSSQAEAIDFYLAELEGVDSVSFASQTAAIDFYLSTPECDPDSMADVSFSSQAEAIEFYLAMVQNQRDGLVC